MIETGKNMVTVRLLAAIKEKKFTKAKANGVRWYGHVLRKDDGHILRKALEFEVKGKRKRGRPRKTWRW